MPIVLKVASIDAALFGPIWMEADLRVDRSGGSPRWGGISKTKGDNRAMATPGASRLPIVSFRLGWGNPRRLVALNILPLIPIIHGAVDIGGPDLIPMPAARLGTLTPAYRPIAFKPTDLFLRGIGKKRN